MPRDGEKGAGVRPCLLFAGVGAGLAAALTAFFLLEARRGTAGRPAPGGGGTPLPTECVGPEDTGLGLIYLHGIDPPDASAQERGNRVAMARLADQLHLRIALARSPDPCPKDASKRCWPNESQAAVQDALRRLLADAGQCFSGRSPQGLVGFSNGGFFVAKVEQYCLMPGLRGIVAIGAAGTWHATDPQDLSNCPRMVAMIGRQDMSHQWAIDYVRHLQARRAKIQLREYAGGHVLPPSELSQVLAGLFPRE